MGKVNRLQDIVHVDPDFSSSINLRLHLNNVKEISKYIPTVSSVSVLSSYLDSLKKNTNQSSVLIGPYGKGKSHLMLVLTGILSLPRTSENSEMIFRLADKIEELQLPEDRTAELMKETWNKGNRFLPVIISSAYSDLKQSFLIALKDALSREGVLDIMPDTAFHEALEKLNLWKTQFPTTFSDFLHHLNQRGVSLDSMIAGLKTYSTNELLTFIDIYPHITSGSEFNVFAVTDVVQLYEDVSAKLQLSGQYAGLFVIFDEFSKYLEGINNTSAGQEMKMLQDFCEFANHSSASFPIFFTIITHKSIKEYGKYLSQNIINGFTGIEGRLTERLFLTSPKNNYELMKWALQKNPEDLEKIPCQEELFSSSRIDAFYHIPYFQSQFTKSDFISLILKGCFPLNPAAAYLLLNVSERIGQNERTLLTFISRDEPGSLARYIQEHNESDSWVVHAPAVYDYFRALLQRETQDIRVHDEWLNAEYALDRCSSQEQTDLVKSLALIRIVNREQELPPTEEFVSLAAGAKNAQQSVEQLIKNGVVYISQLNGTLVFKSRSNTVLNQEISRQKQLLGKNINLGRIFEEILAQPFMYPKRYNSEFEITRYFIHEFMEAGLFLRIGNVDAILDQRKGDGKVLSLYSSNAVERSTVAEHLKQLNDPRLIVVLPHRPFDFENLVQEYESVRKLEKSSFLKDDLEVLLKELPIRLEELSTELRKKLFDLYEPNKTHVLWMNEGNLESSCLYDLNQILNRAAYTVYSKTPVIRNEQINRMVLSTAQTKRARDKIIQAILTDKDDEFFYSGGSQEATIYRSLFIVTGLKSNQPAPELQEMLQLIDHFLVSALDKKMPVSTLVETLSSPPYGIRRSLIPIFLAYVIHKRKEEIILYKNIMETEINAESLSSIVEDHDSYYLFMSKNDLEKETYLDGIESLFQPYIRNHVKEERMNELAQGILTWFRGLPQISRNLSLSKVVPPNTNEMTLKKFRSFLSKGPLNPYELVMVKLPSLTGKEFCADEALDLIQQMKLSFDSYLHSVLQRLGNDLRNQLNIPADDDLYHGLHNWMEEFGSMRNAEMKDPLVKNFCHLIRTLQIYDDDEITKKVIKCISTVYVEDWSENSYQLFCSSLSSLMQKVKDSAEEAPQASRRIIIQTESGHQLDQSYVLPEDSDVNILRNILEDTLEDFGDLSSNDRIAVLVEMIEKIMR